MTTYVPQKSPFEVSATLRAYLEREFAAIARALNEPAPELFPIIDEERAAGVHELVDESIPFGNMLRYQPDFDDCVEAVNASIAVAAEITGGVSFYYPAIGTFWRLQTMPDEITSHYHAYGDGRVKTTLLRDFDASSERHAIFRFAAGAEGSIVEDMGLETQNTREDGSLIACYADASNAGTMITLRNLRLTTNGTFTTKTHSFPIYIDGSDKPTDPLGVRASYIEGCDVFGGLLGAIMIKSTMGMRLIGVNTYDAGGNSGDVHITGLSSVPAYYTSVFGGVIHGFNLDYVRGGLLLFAKCTGDILNTSNTEDVFALGKVDGSTIQNNWVRSLYMPAAGASFFPAGKIGLGGVLSTSHALEALGGGVSGRTSGASSITNIGHVGVPFGSPCPTGQEITFTCGSAKFFHIGTQGGAGALFFTDYLSGTITILDDPSGKFENSSSPSATKTGVYKSASDHVIHVKNNTGITTDYGITVLANVSGATDPA